MTIKTTRRAMLAGAAALPVLATAAPANALNDAVSDPNLAAEFEAFYRKWRAQYLTDEDRQTRFEHLVEAATGIARDRAPDHGEPGYEAYMDARRVVSKNRSEPDPDPEFNRWTPLLDTRDQIVLKILRSPARTVGDLALQAKAFALANCDLWVDCPTNEEPFRMMRYMTESVGKFAGIDALLPGMKIAPIPEDTEEDHPEAEPANGRKRREEPSDPAFAAIEKHRAAYDAMMEKQKEHIAWEWVRFSNSGASKSELKKWRAVDRAYMRVSDRESEALGTVFNTQPTTFAGMCALGLYAAKQLENAPNYLLVQNQDLCAILRALVSPFTAWPEIQETLKQKAIKV